MTYRYGVGCTATSRADSQYKGRVQLSREIGDCRQI